MVTARKLPNLIVDACSVLRRIAETPKEEEEQEPAPKEDDPPLAPYVVKPPFPRALLPNARIETGMKGNKEGYPDARIKKPSLHIQLSALILVLSLYLLLLMMLR